MHIEMRRRTQRRKRSRRSHGRRRRATQKTMTLRSGTVVSPHFVTRLKYSGIVSTGAMVTGAFTDYQFRLNSIFDPDSSGVGHQPMGHDQWNNFYARYRVFGASVIVSYPPNANNIQSFVAIVPTNSATPIPTFDEAKELPRSKWKALSSTNPTTMRLFVSLPNLGGVTTTQYKGDDRFQAQFGANPTEVYNLYICTYNNSGNTQTYTPNVQIIYHIEMFDPFQLGQS